MRVNNLREHKSTIYGLCAGTVFRYEGELYIKTNERDIVRRMCTCVRLIDGALAQHSDTMVVEYYDAEVTIK